MMYKNMMQEMHEKLPPEVLFNIYKFLTPEELGRLGLTSKVLSNELKEANHLWLTKGLQHFPHKKNEILNDPNPNNYVKFIKIYNDEYEGLPFEVRELLSLVKEGEYENLKKMQISFDFFEKQDKSGRTLLDWAWFVGNQHILNLFYKIAKDYFETHPEKSDDCFGRSILFWAIYCNQSVEEIQSLQGNIKVKDCLIKRNEMLVPPPLRRAGIPRLEIREIYDYPLIYAASIDRVDIINFLLENDYEFVNQINDRIINTPLGRLLDAPLVAAANLGNLNSVQAILAHTNTNTKNLLLNFADRNGDTALHHAARNGHEKIVETLIQEGAVIDLTNKIEQMPIILAITNGHYKIAEILLKKIEQDVEKQTKFIDGYKSICEKRISDILQDIAKVVTTTTKKDSFLVFDWVSSPPLDELKKLSHDASSIASDSNLTYLDKIHQIALLITNAYSAISSNKEQATLAKKSKTASELLKVLKKLCNNSGIILKIDDKNQLEQIESLNVPPSLSKIQDAFNKYSEIQPNSAAKLG